MCSNEDHLIQLHMTEPAARDMPFRFRERNSELDWSCVARIDLEQVASDVNVDALQALVAQVLTARVLPTQLPTQDGGVLTAKLIQALQMAVDFLLSVQVQQDDMQALVRRELRETQARERKARAACGHLKRAATER